MKTSFLAVISGESVIHALLWIIIAGVIFGLLTWLISYCGLPEPFAKIARVVVAVFAVLVLVNALLSLAGHPIIAW